MACFLVAAAEAVVVTAAVHSVKRHEKKQAEAQHLNLEQYSAKLASEGTIPWSRKLAWLAELLWGGSLLLCFEHLWHGEVVPWFPFLTAAANPTDAAEMLREMATVGVAMALIVTAAWAVLVAVASAIMKRPAKHISGALQ